MPHNAGPPTSYEYEPEEDEILDRPVARNLASADSDAA